MKTKSGNSLFHNTTHKMRAKSAAERSGTQRSVMFTGGIPRRSTGAMFPTLAKISNLTIPQKTSLDLVTPHKTSLYLIVPLSLPPYTSFSHLRRGVYAQWFFVTPFSTFSLFHLHAEKLHRHIEDCPCTRRVHLVDRAASTVSRSTSYSRPA